MNFFFNKKNKSGQKNACILGCKGISNIGTIDSNSQIILIINRLRIIISLYVQIWIESPKRAINKGFERLPV
jgi:hypothetical protein